MSFRPFRPSVLWLTTLAWLLGGSTLAASSATSPPPRSAVHAAYVLLAGVDGGSGASTTVAYARVVTDPGFACPSISGGEASISMTPRANPYHFPVIVCEAGIGVGQKLQVVLADGKVALPTVNEDPTRIVVMGDTGCKLQEAGSTDGCPAGAAAQPFATLAAAAAASSPDLVLHMGDYNYRGTTSKILFTEAGSQPRQQVANWTYDAGDGTGKAEHCGQAPGASFYSQSSPAANLPDSWAAWREDFFSAAKPLLATSPWVFARGNHELCSRAGPGWFYFLDAGSNLAPTGAGQLSCPLPDPSRDPIDNVVLVPPYAVDVGSLRLLVLDSANACDSFSNTPFVAHYTEQMKRLAELAPSQGHGWLISHRPTWGVTEFEGDNSTGCTSAERYGCINQTLQVAIKQGLGGSLPASVDLLLAGHMHRFQALTFAGARPPLVVVGTSGVALDPSPPTGKFTTTLEGLPVAVLATGAEVSTPQGPKAAFGYLEIDYQSNGTWQGKLIDPSQNLVIAHCGSARAEKGAVCALAPGVTAE